MESLRHDNAYMLWAVNLPPAVIREALQGVADIIRARQDSPLNNLLASPTITSLAGAALAAVTSWLSPPVATKSPNTAPTSLAASIDPLDSSRVTLTPEKSPVDAGKAAEATPTEEVRPASPTVPTGLPFLPINVPRNIDTLDRDDTSSTCSPFSLPAVPCTSNLLGSAIRLLADNSGSFLQVVDNLANSS